MVENVLLDALERRALSLWRRAALCETTGRNKRLTFTERLPAVYPGRQGKFSHYGRILQARMIREELRRRQTENPGLPVTSGSKEQASLAFELAAELRRAGHRISYRTIRRIWESGGHIRGFRRD